MPLDIGAGADSNMVAKEAGLLANEEQGLDSLLRAGANIGQALRALRETKHLTLQDIADITCVRRAYLQAVEEMNIDLLPSRPFAVGYVRAYAEALGVDARLAVMKFREYAPGDDSLKAPVGVRKESDPRLSWLAGAAAVLICAVVVWNVAQHAVAHDGAPTPPAPVTNAAPTAPLGAKGPVALGAAQPAPADSDVPTPYVTPGMAKAVGGPAAAQVADAPQAKPAPLNPRAAAYGAPADKSTITLQALRSASLVVHGADGSIYFARQLAAGESFRAPAHVPGLSLDVSEPTAFNVIVSGQAQGPLPAPKTPLDKLSTQG
jgi:cytoskeletal protein RodZ